MISCAGTGQLIYAFVFEYAEISLSHDPAHTPVGGVAESKLGVCGDSAGGTLAAAVCYALPGKIQYAVGMVYSFDIY